MGAAPTSAAQEAPHGAGAKKRHGWLFYASQGIWLAVIVVGTALSPDAILYRVALVWAAGAAIIWAVGWTWRLLRYGYSRLDWHALGDSVDGHPLGIASTLVAATLVPFFIGAALDVYALVFWGVLTAYTGVAWVGPAVFVWLGVDRLLVRRDVSRHRLLATAASVAAGLVLLLANAAVIDAFDPTA